MPATAPEDMSKGRDRLTKYLTQGSPVKLILAFSIPLLIGNVFQQFYSMADTLIVGRTIGVQALAAVGATSGISFLVLGFVQGLTGGFAVITSQHFGAGDEEGVRRSIAMNILLCAGLGVFLTLLSVLTVRPLLALMRTPADIIEQAYTYIVLIFAGLAATMFYNMLSSLIRALGDSRTPLIFLIIASVLNIGMDFLFILVFSMGVAGAAFATVIAQAISALLCLVYVLRRQPLFRLHRSDFRWDWRYAWRHLRVGLPMAFQFSITAVGVMILQAALNDFGSTTVAGYAAASKIDQLATQALVTIGVTMATFAAQNFGAGRIDRIREGVRRCVLIALVVCVVGGALLYLFGGSLARLFVSGEPAVVDQAVEQAATYLRIATLFYFVLALLLIYRNMLQGIGYSAITMLAGACELVMRAVMAFIAARQFGYIGVCFANPAAWFSAMIPLSIIYVVVMRRLQRTYGHVSEETDVDKKITK